MTSATVRTNSADRFEEIAASVDPTARRNRRIGWWLVGWAVMILLTVVIGGVTRLTESGLSITEWRPASGVIPPLDQAQWEAEFARYREIPQFKLLNPDMTLSGFKRIYFWEYLHRLWARLVGVALLVPLAIGWAKGWFSPRLKRRLVGMLALVSLQGALGWYMVRSGLVARTSVSQYRLAAHLGLALALFCLTLWTAADLVSRRGGGGGGRSIRRHAMLATGLVFLTALAGALVAGTDAGKAYNEFPLMAGRLVPAGYSSLSPWYRNLFDNIAAVQFNHRLLAVMTVAVALILSIRLIRSSVLRPIGFALAGAVAVQFGLGLVTLLWSVPIGAAALHQAGAVVLLGTALLAVHRLSGAAAEPV